MPEVTDEEFQRLRDRTQQLNPERAATDSRDSPDPAGPAPGLPSVSMALVSGWKSGARRRWRCSSTGLPPGRQSERRHRGRLCGPLLAFAASCANNCFGTANHTRQSVETNHAMNQLQNSSKAFALAARRGDTNSSHETAIKSSRSSVSIAYPNEPSNVLSHEMYALRRTTRRRNPLRLGLAPKASRSSQDRVLWHRFRNTLTQIQVVRFAFKLSQSSIICGFFSEAPTGIARSAD